jgi:hypothetical protein
VIVTASKTFFPDFRVSLVNRIARRIAFVPDIVTMTSTPTLDSAVDALHKDIQIFKNNVVNYRDQFLSKSIKSSDWIPVVTERLHDYTAFIFSKLKSFLLTIDRNAKTLGISPLNVDFNFMYNDFFDKVEKSMKPYGSNVFFGTPSFPKCSIDDAAAKDLEQAIYLLIHDPIHEILEAGSSKYLAQHDQKYDSFSLKDRAMEDIPGRLTESRYYDIGVIRILMSSIKDTLFSDRSRFRSGDRAIPIDPDTFSDELIKIVGKIKKTRDFSDLDPFYKELFNKVYQDLEREGPPAIRSYPDPQDLIHWISFRNLISPIVKSAYDHVINRQWTKKNKPISETNAKIIRMYITHITKAIRDASRILNKPLPI